MLNIRNLDVKFNVDGDIVHAVKGISYHVKPGQSVGIGASGSGKSVSAMAIMGLLPSSAQTSGDILFRDTLLSSLSEKRVSSYSRKENRLHFSKPVGCIKSRIYYCEPND